MASKRSDNQIYPDVESPICLGKVQRHKGELNVNHAYKVYESKFVTDAKWQPIKGIGRGAYGVVVSATDTDTNKKVAIKKINKLFNDLVDAKRILREIKLLRHFKHENIIGLCDLTPSPGPLEGLYIVMDFMDTDLHKIIYSSNSLSDEHIQYFIYQVLRGLKYIHSANVIHRDLKPSNLLLNANCHLKICDLGLAAGFKEQAYMTEYVVTRWYRAPEVMCSCEAYDFKIDVWSTGCILAELIMRNPLFPGDSYKEQLNLIFSVLGTPNKEDMSCITNEFALSYLQSMPLKPRVPLGKFLSKYNANVNPLAVDLLEKMLEFNPKRRWTVDQCLAHPYLKELHDPKIEFKCPVPWDHAFEDELLEQHLTKPSLQEFMWDEIYKFRPYLKGVHGKGRKQSSAGDADVQMKMNNLSMQ